MKEEIFSEVSPPGKHGLVAAMRGTGKAKGHPELSRGKTKKGKEKNVYALAWWMHKKGYGTKYKDQPTSLKGTPKKKKGATKKKFSEWLMERDKDFFKGFENPV